MPPAKSAAKKSKPTEELPKEIVPVETTTTVKKSRAKKETNSTETTVSKKVEEVPTTSTSATTTATSGTNQPTTVQNVVVQADTETSITENFSEFIQKFQGMLSQFNSLKAELKTLERKTMRQVKVVQKMNNRKKRKGTRAPSGFVKPSPISDELASFLGKPQGCEMARTDVTREINKYIRANSLQDKDNGRKINPDTELCKLLKVEPDVNLTYFNLQRYMGPHFPKQNKTAPSESGTVSAS
jgi:upstream activation factor subunit UAF30